MKISFLSLAILSALFSSLATAQPACRIEGTASINDHSIAFGQAFKGVSAMGGVPGDKWDATEEMDLAGNQFGSGSGVHEGSDLVFRGRPNAGGFAFGIYPDYTGSDVSVWAELEVSINWTPDTQEVCTDRKFNILKQKSECKRWSGENLPTSFVLDIVTDVGAQRHFVHTFTNENNRNRAVIRTPVLRCLGPVNEFEVRILDLNGGSVEFRLHSAKISAGWKY